MSTANALPALCERSGRGAIVGFTRAFHAKCPADPLLRPIFSDNHTFRAKLSLDLLGIAH